MIRRLCNLAWWMTNLRLVFLLSASLSPLACAHCLPLLWLRSVEVLNTYISQSNAMTQLTCGRIFNDRCSANFLENIVKEFLKLVCIWWRYGQEYCVSFLTNGVQQRFPSYLCAKFYDILFRDTNWKTSHGIQFLYNDYYSRLQANTVILFICLDIWKIRSIDAIFADLLSRPHATTELKCKIKG